MAYRVCPWWVGYLLASPVRCWLGQDPIKILSPYVREGMTVLELAERGPRPRCGGGYRTKRGRASRDQENPGSFALQEVGPCGCFSLDWQTVKKAFTGRKSASGRYKAFRVRKVERSHSRNPPGTKTETLQAIHESKYLSDAVTAEGESLTITQVLAYTLRYGRWVHDRQIAELFLWLQARTLQLSRNRPSRKAPPPGRFTDWNLCCLSRLWQGIPLRLAADESHHFPRASSRTASRIG